MNEYSSRKAERKMLGAIYLVSEAGFYLNRAGLIKFIKGKQDEDTLPISFVRAFGYAPSLSSKTISRRLTNLIKNGFVEVNNVKGLDEALLLTENGLKEIDTNLKPSESALNKKRNIVSKRSEK